MADCGPIELVQGVRDDKNLDLSQIYLHKGSGQLFIIILGDDCDSIPLDYLIRLAAIDPDEKLPDVFIHEDVVYVFCNISLKVGILPKRIGPLLHKILVLFFQVNENVRIVDFPRIFTTHGRMHVLLPLAEPFHTEDVPDGALTHPLLPHFMSKQGVLLSFFGSLFSIVLLLSLLLFWVLLRDFLRL